MPKALLEQLQHDLKMPGALKLWTASTLSMLLAVLDKLQGMSKWRPQVVSAHVAAAAHKQLLGVKWHQFHCKPARHMRVQCT